VGNWEYKYDILANINVYFIAYVVEGITFFIKDIALVVKGTTLSS
jgi:hypothetical protein